MMKFWPVRYEGKLLASSRTRFSLLIKGNTHEKMAVPLLIPSLCLPEELGTGAPICDIRGQA